MTSIAVLIPTIYRPKGLTRVLWSLKDAPVVSVVALEADDYKGAEICNSFGAKTAICRKEKAGCAYAWNTALEAYPDADVYVIGSDDAIFIDGWLEESLKVLEDIGGSGLVGFNCHWKPTDLAFHYLMTRDFMIEHHGGVAAIPHYSSWCVDDEACLRAIAVNKFAKAKDAYVEHEWRRDGLDEGYKLGEERRAENKKLFFERKAKGFPDDFEAIIK